MYFRIYGDLLAEKEHGPTSMEIPCCTAVFLQEPRGAKPNTGSGEIDWWSESPYPYELSVNPSTDVCVSPSSGLP